MADLTLEQLSKKMAKLDFAMLTTRSGDGTMTARPMTIAQPPAQPCTNRAAIMTPMDGVRAHTTEAALTRVLAQPRLTQPVRHACRKTENARPG